MVRLFSIILILLGLAAAGYGGLRLLSDDTAEPGVSPSVSGAEVRQVEIVRSGDRGSAKDTGGLSSGLDDAMADVMTTAPSFIDTLQKVPLAHETPERARFGRAFDVTLAIDGTGDDSATEALPGRGRIVEGEGFVGVNARATLSGAAFDIEATTPGTQTVSPITENVWRWRVTPRETGAQQLTLELFALDGERALPVRTFKDEIIVEVSRFGQAVAMAQSISPLAMVIGGIGSLIAGLFGAARFFRGH
ncbi:MAG: hypothetical protein AAFR74_08015 [Pseudomonadota bacterium]